MDKEDLGLGPHLSASSTSVIPVGTLRGGAKLYGEPFLYGGKVNTWYVFIRAEFHDFAEVVPFILWVLQLLGSYYPVYPCSPLC